MAYFGKICEKHPELKGERQATNSVCLGCRLENGRRWQKNNPIAVKVKAQKHRDANKERQKIKNASRDRSGCATVRAWNSTFGRIYHQIKDQRTPAWADRNKIAAIYREAKELGLTVDHVIPLHGKFVSGLHVHNNLQLLPGPENFGKGNRYEPGG